MKNKLMKKTKIVATIGPVSEGEEMMTKLVNAGVDVIRLNFSHGDFEEHGNRVKTVRKISKKLDKTVAILQDLGGPKIRIGEFYKDKIVLKNGSEFTLTTKKIVGDETIVFVNYPRLPQEVKKGGIILLDDGKKKLEILSTSKDKIKCKVLVGGETKGKRGVNVPGAYLKISSITPKDKKDLVFGIKNDVDFIALSFVRDPKDILQLRKIMDNAKFKAGIIAKIETQEAIDNIDEIIKVADGIMVARGDLAIEVPAENVPMLQKMIIKKCNIAGKPVITATQMLESMIHSPVPTRAEISDVANSILDGTDAIMLSEETTLGEYPLEAVSMMSKVAIRANSVSKHRSSYDNECMVDTAGAVTYSVVRTAEEVGAKAIIALTESGFTGRMISRFKPAQPIVAMSSNPKTLRSMILSYGCYPLKIGQFKYVGEVVSEVDKFVSKYNFAKKGDKIVIVAGMPFGKSGGTNLMFVHEV